MANSNQNIEIALDDLIAENQDNTAQPKTNNSDSQNAAISVTVENMDIGGDYLLKVLSAISAGKVVSNADRQNHLKTSIAYKNIMNSVKAKLAGHYNEKTIQFNNELALGEKDVGYIKFTNPNVYIAHTNKTTSVVSKSLISSPENHNALYSLLMMRSVTEDTSYQFSDGFQLSFESSKGKLVNCTNLHILGSFDYKELKSGNCVEIKPYVSKVSSDGTAIKVKQSANPEAQAIFKVEQTQFKAMITAIILEDPMECSTIAASSFEHSSMVCREQMDRDHPDYTLTMLECLEFFNYLSQPNVCPEIEY